MKDRAIIFNDIVSHIRCLPNEPISRPSTCDWEDYKDTSAFLFLFEEKRSTGRIPLSSKGRVVKLVDENNRRTKRPCGGRERGREKERRKHSTRSRFYLVGRVISGVRKSETDSENETRSIGERQRVANGKGQQPHREHRVWRAVNQGQVESYIFNRH